MAVLRHAALSCDACTRKASSKPWVGSNLGLAHCSSEVYPDKHLPLEQTKASVLNTTRLLLLAQLGGGTIELGDAEGTTITVEVTASPGAQVMARNAADLRRFGKDRFVIQV